MTRTLYTLHYKAGVWECSTSFMHRWDLENYLYEWFTFDPEDWDREAWDDSPPMFCIEQVNEMYVTIYQEAAAA